ncbi:MAG: hypothetical protein ABIF82_12170 [Planctomycetota bacterium]
MTLQNKGKMVVTICVMLAALAPLTGCSAEYWTGRIEPQTRLTLNPVTRSIDFFDSRENDVEITGLSASGDGEQFELKADTIRIVNRSAPVIDADAARLPQILELQRVQVEYQRQIGQNIALGIAAGGDAVNKVLGTVGQTVQGSTVHLQTPWGSGQATLGTEEKDEGGGLKDE